MPLSLHPSNADNDRRTIEICSGKDYVLIHVRNLERGLAHSGAVWVLAILISIIIIIVIIIIDIIIMYHGVLGGSLSLSRVTMSWLQPQSPHAYPLTLLLIIIATPYPMLYFSKQLSCFVLWTPQNKPMKPDCLAFHFMNRDTEAQRHTVTHPKSQQIRDVRNLGSYRECLLFPSQSPGRWAHAVKSAGSAFQSCLQLYTWGRASNFFKPRFPQL